MHGYKWPINCTRTRTAVDANPRSFGPLGCDMNRPFEYALFEPRGLIFIACRADYGIAGGGLACFDPLTKEKRVFRDKLQSVQSVAADHQFVYGGTYGLFPYNP